MRKTIIITLAALLLGGCGGKTDNDGKHSYVGTASNSALYITWTRTGSDLSGSLTQAIRDDEKNTVNTSRASFSGTVSGSGVSLELGQGLGTSSTLSGELHDGNLDLDFQGTDGGITTVHLKTGDPSDFNSDLAHLRTQAADAQAAADQTQQQAQDRQDAQQLSATIAQELQGLQADANDPTRGNGNSYSTDLQTVKDDVDIVQRDAQQVADEAGSTDSGTVCSDDGTVQSDVGTVEADVATIEADQAGTDGDTTGVDNAIKLVREHFAALQQFDPAALPGDAPSQSQIESAIRRARRSAKQDTSTGGGAKAQADALLRKARGYQAQADAVCKRVGG